MHLGKRSTNRLSSGRVNSHAVLRNCRIHHVKLIHNFSNPKSWMTSEVMEAVLARFDRKLVFEDRKVIFFLDDATCHPESMIGHFSQIKIIFLLNNTTSRLQPLGAGIIQNIKVKYRKRLQEDASATQIVKGVDVLVVI